MMKIERQPKALGPADYRRYIQSEVWAVKRRAFLKLEKNRECYCCAADNVPLDVHHKTYERLGIERFSDLAAVCRPCHDRIHAIVYKRRISILEATQLVRKTAPIKTGWIDRLARIAKSYRPSKDKAVLSGRFYNGGATWTPTVKHARRVRPAG